MPTPEQIDEFLDKLNDDVDFRARLIEEPGEVLSEYDISYGPGDIPSETQLYLPDPGEVNANRAAFKEMFFEVSGFMWNAVDFRLPGS